MLLVFTQTKETDETSNRNPLGLFDCRGHWRWHGCVACCMVVVMKMRQRKAVIMARIMVNNKTTWYIAPFLKRSQELKARNDRINAALERFK